MLTLCAFLGGDGQVRINTIKTSIVHFDVYVRTALTFSLALPATTAVRADRWARSCIPHPQPPPATRIAETVVPSLHSGSRFAAIASYKQQSSDISVLFLSCIITMAILLHSSWLLLHANSGKEPSNMQCELLNCCGETKQEMAHCATTLPHAFRIAVCV
jgi:hypothetical protein